MPISYRSNEEKQQKQQNTPKSSDKQASKLLKSNWREEANCLGKANLMFPAEHKDISYVKEARRICRECSVRKECLDEALKWPTTDMHGVWAGLTPRQLAAEQHRRGIIPTKMTLAEIWSELNKEEKAKVIDDFEW